MGNDTLIYGKLTQTVEFHLRAADFSTEEELHAKIKELSARYSEGYALRIVVD